MAEVLTLKPFINGAYVESRTTNYHDAYNPSTGEVIARVPACTEQEVDSAISAAAQAYPAWAATPVLKRVEVLHRLRAMLVEEIDELTHLVALENGKSWEEARGDILKAKEGTEHALAAPELLMGESLMQTSGGFDSVLYRESVGVFLGIVPFNFPAMIPMGWMTPMCIACGNTMVIKASSLTPQTALRIAGMYAKAGLPEGVLNVITCNRTEASAAIQHRDVQGVSFVGSTGAGMHVYTAAAAAGKRVQILGEAKNHALVMDDAPIERSAAGIINSAFGCAGERCMALPVVVVLESIADKLVAALVEQAQALKIGPAYDKETTLGPVVNAAHRDSIIKWIEKGVQEGATLVLDGRNCTIPGFENGFYLGPTIFDHVQAGMTIGDEEIFGPVLCIKRVKHFEEGLTLMNQNPCANGSVIFTQNGYFAREFAYRTHSGMVGINVGIPVPVGMFPFSGHKRSFIGDLHCLGKDGVRFYTETKVVTSRWFDEAESRRRNVSTWDGTI